MDASVVEIHIPQGWEYVNNPDITTDDPTASGDATISVSGSVVTVTQADNPVDTTIAFNVKAPNSRGDFQFTTKSKSKTGALTNLDVAAAPADSPVQPSVPVGNIMAGLGSVVIRADDDAAAYQGDQDVDFEVTLTAAGPMYSIDKVDTDGDGDVDGDDTVTTQQAMIAIVFPFAVAVGTLGGARPAAAIASTFDGELTGSSLSRLMRLMWVMSLSSVLIISTSRPMSRKMPIIMDNIQIYTSTKAGAAAYVRFTDIENASLPDVTPAVPSRVDGGYILPKAGSGKVETDPEVVEKGTEKKNITLTYTAATQLIPVGLVDGTQLYGSMLPFAANEIVSASPTRKDTSSTLSVIIWKQEATHTAEDQTFEVTVEMNIPDDTDPLEFPTRVGSDTAVIATDPWRILLMWMPTALLLPLIMFKSLLLEKVRMLTLR